jgi:hypothetical protein
MFSHFWAQFISINCCASYTKYILWSIHFNCASPIYLFYWSLDVKIWQHCKVSSNLFSREQFIVFNLCASWSTVFTKRKWLHIYQIYKSLDARNALGKSKKIHSIFCSMFLALINNKIKLKLNESFNFFYFLQFFSFFVGESHESGKS